MPQLPGAGGGGGDPELCATDEMIPFKDEGDPQKEKIFAEISHPEEEGDLADIKSSLVNESEIAPGANGHEVRGRGGSAGQHGPRGRGMPAGRELRRGTVEKFPIGKEIIPPQILSPEVRRAEPLPRFGPGRESCREFPDGALFLDLKQL